MPNDSTDVFSSRNNHRFLHTGADVASESNSKDGSIHTFSTGKSDYLTIKM